MYPFETSHQIATDGDAENIYRIFRHGEHIIDASYSGGPYIDMGSYDESTGEFEAREVVNVWNYTTSTAEITNSVGQVEDAVIGFLFSTECSVCNADVDESETDNSGRCEDCQANLCEYCEDAVKPEGVDYCDECEKWLQEN